MTVPLESADLSDMGRKRKNNEDACLRLPDQGIYCVADGMGGQAGGDLASEAIVTNLQEVFSTVGATTDLTFSRQVELFCSGVNKASQWIKRFADEKVIGRMGSTVAGLVVDLRHPSRAMALHAGDSRVYRYRAGTLNLITTDHSAVVALAAKLGKDPSELPARYQNELLRAVGVNETVDLEKTPVEVLSGDMFLLCSDGLTKMIPDAAIAGILGTGGSDPAGSVAQTLIDAANEAGGRDNVSVVLLKVGGIGAYPPPPAESVETTPQTPQAPVAPVRDGDEATPSVTPGDVAAFRDSADSLRGQTPSTGDPAPDRTPPTPSDPQAGPAAPPQRPQIRRVRGIQGGARRSPRRLTPGTGLVLAVALLGLGASYLFLARPSTRRPVPLPTQEAPAAGPEIAVVPVTPAPSPEAAPIIISFPGIGGAPKHSPKTEAPVPEQTHAEGFDFQKAFNSGMAHPNSIAAKSAGR
jgi:serine/threonine protein phosphatase PrpC